MSGYNHESPSGEQYINPAFTPQPHSSTEHTPRHNINYEGPQNQGEYTAPVYGRTPLRHQQSYGQSGFEAQPRQQSPQPPQINRRSIPGTIQEDWDPNQQHQYSVTSPISEASYHPNQAEISPSRPRGLPADENISYSNYGNNNQYQNRALLPTDINPAFTPPPVAQYQDNPPPMRQIHRGYPSRDSLQPGIRPGPASISSSAAPSTAGDRGHGIASNNSNRASSVNLGFYSDSPYQRYSTHWNPETSGLDSGDLSLQDMRRSSQDSDDDEIARGKRTKPLAGGLGGVFGKKPETGSTVSGLGANSTLLAAGLQSRGGGAPAGDSDWLQSQKKAKKKTKWIIAAVVLVILLLAGGGAAAGVILSKKKSSGGGSATSSVDPQQDAPGAPLVNSGTDSVKNLLNNPNLHKSFYGMDYTPLDAIYPQCIPVPPTQNNITKDIAVISQLTSRLRLYGNDCNQTQMVLEAIKILNVDMKVWMGVYIDSNQTTNVRQLNQMYEILDQYGTDPFLGVVIGNEALFSQYITETALIQLLGEVRQNFTNLGYKINITTSDLGSAWTYNLAQAVDTVMANVHPFFGGVAVNDAADWTWKFTQDNDVAYAKQTTRNPNVIISEVGWPSGGGTDGGSVAGINELNQFVEQFACAANANGTEYYWFVPFDEPWKYIYNEPGKEWETQWGLMDVNRNIKPGVTIPDCPAR
ncbi:hypothetical protein TWF694_006538 [Orbilia ellipsospora]|uniref:glucan endo-1,3-beta-D-glucosidase n=2 Tax=Orbilia ellipsospora TaxID=2528407 RepID=A0AAV9XKS4_9PEZI